MDITFANKKMTVKHESGHTVTLTAADLQKMKSDEQKIIDEQKGQLAFFDDLLKQTLTS